MIEVTYAGLVREVEIADGGEAHPRGQYSAMGSPSFPAMASLTYFFALRSVAESPTEILGELQLLDATGRNLLRPAGIWKQSVPAGEYHVKRALKLPTIMIRQPGEYRFRILVDGVEISVTPMLCTKTQPAQSALSAAA